MSVSRTSDAELTTGESRNLQRLAGFMVPADSAYGVPGADDETIFADIVQSLGRDARSVRTALAMLQEIAGGDLCSMGAVKAEAAAMALLGFDDLVVQALGRVVLQCYYRDDRVLRSLNIEPLAPFPKGRLLEQGDWSLLDVVRGRKQMWRDDRERGAT